MLSVHLCRTLYPPILTFVLPADLSFCLDTESSSSLGIGLDIWTVGWVWQPLIHLPCLLWHWGRAPFLVRVWFAVNLPEVHLLLQIRMPLLLWYCRWDWPNKYFFFLWLSNYPTTPSSSQRKRSTLSNVARLLNRKNKLNISKLILLSTS